MYLNTAFSINFLFSWNSMRDSRRILSIGANKSANANNSHICGVKARVKFYSHVSCMERACKAAATRAIFCLRWWCFFLKIVKSPARGKNSMCSHRRTGDVTAERIAEKKLREIEWVESRTLSPSVATTSRRRRHNFQKNNRITIAT